MLGRWHIFTTGKSNDREDRGLDSGAVAADLILVKPIILLHYIAHTSQVRYLRFSMKTTVYESSQQTTSADGTGASRGFPT